MTTTWVLLHGFLGCPADWERLRSDLPGPAAALEIFGHRRRAEASAPGDFEAEVDRLAAEIASRRLGRVQLVGYSLGARLALGLLARHPGCAAGATLIGLHPGLISPDERADRVRADEAWATRLESQGVDAFLADWQAQPLFASQSSLAPEVSARQRDLRRLHDARALAAGLRLLSLGRMPERWSALAAIQVPVTLVHGAADRKFAALAERAAARLPRASRIAIAGAGHNPVLERPEALAAALSGTTQGDG